MEGQELLTDEQRQQRANVLLQHEATIGFCELIFMLKERLGEAESVIRFYAEQPLGTDRAQQHLAKWAGD